MEDDASVSDRLKTRFQMFGQFFKRFLTPESEIPPTIFSDQVYDDTRKFHKTGVLEFQKPSPVERQYQPPLDGSPGFGHFSADLDMFGQTKSLYEEFEQAMKLFDEFAFILQHPNTGPTSPGFEIPSLQDEDDEARYFKFFGKSAKLPQSTIGVERENPSDDTTRPEENYRHLMLKADSHENRRSQVGIDSKSSILSSVFGSSWWNSDVGKSKTDPTGSDGQRFPHGNRESHGRSYFQFTSEETSLKSDGLNVRVNATKIRETPEGREVISYKTNEQGVTEEVREFIPRKDLPNAPSSANSILGGFFRPRF